MCSWFSCFILTGQITLNETTGPTKFNSSPHRFSSGRCIKYEDWIALEPSSNSSQPQIHTHPHPYRFVSPAYLHALWDYNFANESTDLAWTWTLSTALCCNSSSFSVNKRTYTEALNEILHFEWRNNVLKCQFNSWSMDISSIFIVKIHHQNDV